LWNLDYQPLEPLTGYLAYLDLKLWLKKQKLGKIQLPEKAIMAIFDPWPYLAS